MLRIFLMIISAARVSAWYTGGGYASSAVDVYVSGGSTEMFGSVSSGGGSSSPTPPVTKTCANRNAACEWVPSWDSDGLYCSLGSGNYCVDLCDSSLDASACDEADGCVHDGSSCRVADTCASGVKIEGTDIDVSQVFAEFPDNFFDGAYIRTGYSLNGEPVFASTESSPALLLYYGTCQELSDDEGAWLLHLTFADPTNSAAVAEDISACPHLVQLRSGRRLPGKARADNAKATTVSSVSYQRSTVSVTCLDAQVPCGADAVILNGARVESASDGTSYGLFDGAYTLGNAATVNWQPLLKKQTELMTWYMYYCARLGTWVVGSESDVEDARAGGCRGHVVIDTADDAVRVSTESGFVPASATVSCAAAEGGACAGEVVRIAGTSLYWPGAEGTSVSKTFLEGAYEKNGITTPDGFPVYESRLVDGLELLRCDNRWRIAYAKDHEDDPCGSATVLGYVGTPDLSVEAPVFSNIDHASCTGVPCHYDVDVGATATCIEAFTIEGCAGSTIEVSGASEFDGSYDVLDDEVNGQPAYIRGDTNMIYYCPSVESWVVAKGTDVDTDACYGDLQLFDSVLGGAVQVWWRHADNEEPVRADGVVATCTGVPTPAPTAGGGLRETDAAAAARAFSAALLAATFFL